MSGSFSLSTVSKGILRQTMDEWHVLHAFKIKKCRADQDFKLIKSFPRPSKCVPTDFHFQMMTLNGVFCITL